MFSCFVVVVVVDDGNGGGGGGSNCAVDKYGFSTNTYIHKLLSIAMLLFSFSSFVPHKTNIRGRPV